jgi:CubicO group peptidase (beta-lactamase class C family)
VLHEGELVEQQALGSYTLDTVVPIASASKWLAGATIMTVVDEGRIDLDAPIRTYLPQATGPSTQQYGKP